MNLNFYLHRMEISKCIKILESKIRNDPYENYNQRDFFNVIKLNNLNPKIMDRKVTGEEIKKTKKKKQSRVKYWKFA